MRYVSDVKDSLLAQPARRNIVSLCFAEVSVASSLHFSPEAGLLPLSVQCTALGISSALVDFVLVAMTHDDLVSPTTHQNGGYPSIRVCEYHHRREPPEAWLEAVSKPLDDQYSSRCAEIWESAVEA